MMKKNILQDVITEYTSQGYTPEETLEHITKIANDMLDNEVDLSNLMKLGQVYIDAEKTYVPLNDNALTEARDNLYKQYEIDFENSERILENTLYELSKYDKLIDYDGVTVPFLLNQVLGTLFIYANLFLTWADQKKLDSLNRTIAHTSSTTTKKMLSPLNPYIKDNPYTSAMSTKVLRNIYEDFIEDPYGTDYALSHLRLLDPDDFKKMEKEKVDAFYQSTKFINSNGQVEKKDIFNSLKIQISRLYLQNDVFQIILKDDKHISKEKLARHIDVIMEHVFETKSTTRAPKLGTPTQVRTYYEGIPLLEYTRKGKEKKHPMLEDPTILNELSEKIKGKVPPKQS